ncbi:hypothetical protein ACVWYG_003967, partial [Pedobacter sp. UYEF25]
RGRRHRGTEETVRARMFSLIRLGRGLGRGQ